MLLTYKYRIKDTNAKTELRRLSVVINQVWNYCVETQHKVQQIYRLGSKKAKPSLYDLTSLTKGTSQDIKINAQSIQNICEKFIHSRDLHKKCPKFRKSLGSKRSLGWVPFQEQGRKITSSSVTYLGKTYKFFGAKRRPLPSNAKGGCFVEDSRGRWYVCFQVEVQPDTAHGPGVVGIDLGLKTLATTSDGKKYDNTRVTNKYAEKLAKAHRANNKKQTRNIHAKIKNVRSDYLHKLSSELIKDNSIIFVGNVNSAKLGKTRMAKSVYDASWATLREILRYKASRHGVQYRVINEAFTSQTCSCCGSLPSTRPKGIAGLGIRSWVCSDCGASHDRDVNAAKNILRIGLSTQPPVEEILFSWKSAK